MSGVMRQAGAAGSCKGSHRAPVAFSAPRRNAASRAFRRRIAARAWNDDVKFVSAKIVDKFEAATDMHVLTVSVDAETANAYKHGGQYLQMKVGDDGKPAYLAIANAPESVQKDKRMEFLVKKTPGNHEDIIGSTDVMVSAPAGKGFPIDKVPPSDVDTVLIFATGSGISPIKALFEADALKTKERKDVRLYYGARDIDHMAYADRIPEWEEQGVKVTKVFSRRGDGYVQDVFASDKKLQDGSKACALLCGQKEMAFAVRDMLTEQGVQEDKFLTNF